MTDVLVGAAIVPEYWPASVHHISTVSNFNITDTSPASLSPTVGGTWVASKTGRAWIIVGMGARDPNGRVYSAPCTWEGTSTAGTPVIDPTDADLDEQWAVSTTDNNGGYQFGSRRALLTGLTPGATYYTEVYTWADAAGTADITVRDFTVMPAM